MCASCETHKKLHSKNSLAWNFSGVFYHLSNIMKLPPQLLGALLATAAIAGLLALIWDKPADISHYILPKQNRDRLLRMFLYGEFSRTAEDGTTIVEKRFRVPSEIVDVSKQIPPEPAQQTPEIPEAEKSNAHNTAPARPLSQ
jgi:hypothetical protein